MRNGAQQQTIMSELTKNVQPLEDFNWDEFEKGTVANVSKEDLDKAYDNTLNWEAIQKFRLGL